MSATVAAPKLFLRGNRWYVRVQVPASMQGVLKRKEFWVALKTADRSKALETAATAAQSKRQDLLAEFDRLSGGGLTDDDHDRSLMSEDEQAGDDTNLKVDHNHPTDVENTDLPIRSKYDRLSKAQLIQLLEQQDHVKKLGLVWERGETAVSNHDVIVADVDVRLSGEAAPWDNLVIEGDNYDALRWLRATHLGRIKCIYIDPPYNTGNTNWVFNDRFSSANDRFQQSTWLEFLYRRFELARDLLTDDGVILVSINDENRAALELLMRDALPKLRIGSLVWRTRNGSNADQGGYLSPDHEHVLVAAKKGFTFCGTERSYATYTNPDGDQRGEWQAVPIRLGFSRHERPNLFYPMHDPETGIYYPCNPDSVWRFATRKRVTRRQRLQTQHMEDFIEQGRIKFPTDQRIETFETLNALKEAIDEKEVPLSRGVPMLRHDMPDLPFWIGKKIGYGTPIRKLFKSELRRPTKPLSSWITRTSEANPNDEGTIKITAGSYTEGSQDILRIFGSKMFNYAKPASLIRELLRQSTSTDDVVLDFFAGSATTAQAVMELNAEDGAKRRFIMASSTEVTDTDPDKNLCRDVTSERIRLLNASSDQRYADLSAGFAYLRTNRVSIDTIDYDLKPSTAWTFLEALHGMPLTQYEPNRPWNISEGADVTMVLVDRFHQDLVDWLRTRSAKNLHVYAWANGPFEMQLASMGIQVLSVVQVWLGQAEV